MFSGNFKGYRNGTLAQTGLSEPAICTILLTHHKIFNKRILIGGNILFRIFWKSFPVKSKILRRMTQARLIYILCSLFTLTHFKKVSGGIGIELWLKMGSANPITTVSNCPIFSSILLSKVGETRVISDIYVEPPISPWKLFGYRKKSNKRPASFKHAHK